MAQVAESLVGRDAELVLLEGVLEEACQGAYRFVAVSGEPGVGKTSLLLELRRRAEARGCLVLGGRASELERELPFGLVVDAFDAYLESLDPRTYERLARDGLGELAAVFPSLRALSTRSDEPRTPAERFRAHHAVRDLMERLAARQPFLLELDDVHWSDGASIELIGHLLRRPAQAAVMVVVAFRTGRADAVLVAALEAAMRGGEVKQVVLGPLARAAAEQLLASRGAAERERLYRETGGNPFYLLELARGGAAANTPGGRRAGETDGVPAAVGAAIAGELERLAPAVRAFAEAAAVAGDPFEFDLAVAAGGVPEAEGLSALDELVACELIRPGEVPRRFQFRHPLVRRAVYQASSPGMRLAAHERSARALAARGASAVVRAHHVEQSARVGDAAAVAVLREAGQVASERAPSSAARWFEAALRLLPETAPREERAGLLLALAGSWAATGRLEESRGALLSALELSPPEDTGGRVELISACAGVEQLLGRHTQAHDRLVSALERLPDDAWPEVAALEFELALDAFYGMEYERMEEWGVKALATARTLDDRGLMASAAAIASFAGTLSPETVGRARVHHLEAATLVDALSDDELAQHLHAVAWLAPSEFYLDLYQEGIAHAERGLAVARATGQSEFFPGLTQALANLLFTAGRPREAGDLLDGAVDAARLSDNALGLAWSLLNRGFAAICEGEPAVAMRASEEAIKLTEGIEDSPVAGWAGAVYGRALLEAGDAQRAYDVLVRSCGGEELPRIPGAWRAIWLEVMTSCCLELDRLGDARRAAALAAEAAARFGLPLAAAIAPRAAAAVSLKESNPAAALQPALDSAARAEELGARIESALSRELAGRALAALGDTDRAAAELQRAAAELDACGAARTRRRVERELRKLGRGVHRRTHPGEADERGIRSLSGRELEVARLVVDRRSNPEIAAELFLSIKTVETHMRNIFRKLGAGSRVEVARIIEREEGR